MVRFDKNKSNDQRNSRVAEGKAALESASGIKASACACACAAMKLGLAKGKIHPKDLFGG
ncbi:hypothetical protein [Phaeobacter inhibens]|uniref:hypothetical protein n=1 Tax=Phaeobacter inhibens TaxID=221822 RepID=UPI0021A62AA6|nr:hypothetical protein [Phaeobacter inhibens]UWR69941.1 hypothetical protein K4K95_07105 [Phaeobacter inhibens]UWR73910.1 hypothetical protein K4L00_07345 [Phaeobacter inhibens]